VCSSDLDSRGAQLSSEAFAKLIATSCENGQSDIAFLIGGAEGLTKPLLARANKVLSLGAMTWPHLLVRTLLAEQLYRAQTILSGHPYHRG
jgi:23S rRNA (pseudouridine1915-N3)-methyltransferase